jgi:hypothetical protein
MDNRNNFSNNRNIHRDANEENRFMRMLFDIMTEYNYTVRINDRRFHDNISNFLQIIQNNQTSMNRQRRYQYNHPYPQNNNSIPNQRYAFYATPFTDTIYTNIINETVNNMLPGLFPEIPVNLTEQQINNATETFNYYAGEHAHTTCPISLDEFHEGERICKITHCGHMFREAAIKNWFRRNVRCPVCRHDIRTQNETEPADDESESPQAEEPVRNGNVDRIIQNLSNGLQNIIHNYMDGDASSNRSFTFELPVYIYNDLSGNRL